MSGFDPGWLALREPYDHAVRDPELTTAFAQALGAAPRLIDLGCGSGSNLRHLAPHLPKEQRWTCIDHDPRLLDVLQSLKPAGIEVDTVCLDLAKKLDDLPIEPGIGITSTALLDLTSATWLDQLAERCRDHPVLMTLAVDGVMTWQPEDPLDDAVSAAFWRHQATDKGFGPACGPDAACHLAGRFDDLGHDVRIAGSDWILAAGDGEILRPLLQGIVAAAMEIAPGLPLQSWLERRLADVRAGRLTMTVGHDDLLALPR